MDRQMGLICAVPRRSSTWRPRDYAGPPSQASKIVHRCVAELSSDTETSRNTRGTTCNSPRHLLSLLIQFHHPRQLPYCRNIKRAVACYSCAIRTARQPQLLPCQHMKTNCCTWTIIYEHPKRPRGLPCLVNQLIRHLSILSGNWALHTCSGSSEPLYLEIDARSGNF